MGSLLLLSAALLFLSCSSSIGEGSRSNANEECPCQFTWAGKEFALTFLQNYRPNYDTPSFQLRIIAVDTDTKVNVEVPSLKFREVRDIKVGKGVTIVLPSAVELSGTKKSSNTVRIEASAPVTVSSFNHKDYTTDSSVILPSTQWGSEYFIFTPPNAKYTEFAVTNGKEPNRVEISPIAPVKFQEVEYQTGSKIQIDLQPFESVQLQGEVDLSGTQITSTKPVAVFSGHTCISRFSRCNHLYEQLLPVSKWGAHYIVPPLSIQTQFDSVYIQASQSTRVTVQNDKGKNIFRMNKGDSKEITYKFPTTLAIEADHAIQVLLMFNGVFTSNHQMFDSFLINILPTNLFCSVYGLQGLNGFDNQALIVAKTNEMLDIKLDGKGPRNVQWKGVEGTDYSWAQISYNVTGDGSGPTVSSSGPSFGLYDIGFFEKDGYGSQGQCIKPGPLNGNGNVCLPSEACGCSHNGHVYRRGEIFYPKCVEKCTCGEKGEVSCQKAKCPSGETCTFVNGVKGCHPGAKCVASGDPHYTSFDGHKFEFQGIHVYVLTKVCDDVEDQLTPFTVRQGNGRFRNGNLAVTRSVGVAVYGFNIFIQQGSKKVIVNDTGFNLPLSLHDGCINVTQEGRNIIVATDFGLTVLYDTVFHVEVNVPSTYEGKMCGLCGNYNKNPKDEFKLPDGTQNDNADTFGEAWVVVVD